LRRCDSLDWNVDLKKYIFDVDGTLTPSRKPIEQDFRDYFQDFASKHSVYLVTGSDRKKTLQQIGQKIYDLCERVYQCSGNDVWEKDQHIRSSEIEIPCNMYEDFTRFFSESNFKIRTGTHLDKRPGLVNFSIIGRNCTQSERQEYIEYDNAFQEREHIAAALRRKYSDFDIQIAGETGIDITLKGKDKSQIIKDFDTSDQLHFFGDKMNPNGNDYSLAQRVLERNRFVYNVKSWEETWEHLKKLSV